MRFVRHCLRRLFRRDDALLHRVIAAVDAAVRTKLQALQPELPVLDPIERDLLEAAHKELLWLDPRTEKAMLDTDSGEAREVDVGSMQWGPLIIHDAIDWSLPPEQRPARVKYRVTRIGERFL